MFIGMPSLNGVTGRPGAPSHVAQATDKLAETAYYVNFRGFFDFRQYRIEAYEQYNPEFSPVQMIA
jgi:hypothetical protein